MVTIVAPEVERYAHDHTTPESPLLSDLARETRERFELWQMQVGRIEGTFLKLMVRLCGARRVIEIGMFTGFSALMMAEALPDDGRLVTCDVDPVAARTARAAFDRSEHGHKIEVRMGPALETLATLEGPFDMAFIDADKPNYVSYYERCIELLRPGGIVVADNALWGGSVLAPSDVGSRAIATFNDRVARDPRVEHVLLTIRDGVMLARKR